MVEQNYNQILDSLTTAIIVLYYDLRVAHVNASAETLFGISSEQLIDKPFATCFGIDDGTPASLTQELSDNRHFTKRKSLWTLHNGNEITVDYTVTPSPDIGHMTLEVQPLDRLLRISREEAWISSQETSRNLVRSLAHEIKNPLGGIRGAAQLLSRELNDSQLEEYTRIIVEETDRLRDLVDRMLGPRSLPEVKELNIHEILAHVSSVAEMEVQDSICLEHDYDPSIPEMYGDRTQLIQAFLNIVRNAVQALSENEAQQEPPRIRITTRIKRRYTIGRTNYPLVVKVTILDNGPGIAHDIIDDIFFPMITGRSAGTGLGLSISQNLIGQHRGLIECTSEHGATEFAVYIPLGNQHA